MAFDYTAIGRHYGVDDRTAKRTFSKALDVMRQLLGNIPQGVIERDYEDELKDNFIMLLQDTKGKYKESVKRVKERSEHNWFVVYDDIYGEPKVFDGFSNKMEALDAMIDIRKKTVGDNSFSNWRILDYDPLFESINSKDNKSYDYNMLFSTIIIQ